MSDASNDTDPPGAWCVCVSVRACACVRVCGWVFVEGSGRSGGQLGRQEAWQESVFPTAAALYLRLRPPGRSDTGGEARGHGREERNEGGVGWGREGVEEEAEEE